MSTILKGKTTYMVLKLDISKTYNRVEWSFLEGIMRNMGFDDRWIQLINDELDGRVVPTISIRQGDPLCSYSFYYMC
jgi:hypothetical protein